MSERGMPLEPEKGAFSAQERSTGGGKRPGKDRRVEPRKPIRGEYGGEANTRYCGGDAIITPSGARDLHRRLQWGKEKVGRPRDRSGKTA